LEGKENMSSHDGENRSVTHKETPGRAGNDANKCAAGKPVRAARPAPVRAVLLDAVLRRRERQRVQGRLHQPGHLSVEQVSGIDPGTAAFLISAIFILPFVLFSATSGQLADKYDKATVMRLVKNLEIAIMVLGSVGFVTYSVTILFAATFLMGLHSTLFGPVKYAYLPQHLQPRN
jgi:hypothetical protein